ncbi:MAG: class I SAM-dependent methyltransferase [Planctomycetota bacterium]
MSLKAAYKRVMAKLLRSGLVEVNDRLEEIEVSIRAHGAAHAVWRGTLAEGAARDGQGTPIEEATAKLREELGFWVRTKRDPSALEGVTDLLDAMEGWQRGRLDELATALKTDGGGLRDWCAKRSVVEIGAGPYPMIAVAKWARAVAVDPLADGYASEGLLPATELMRSVVYLAAPGEAVPLPSGFADLVVIENCLDHVADPPRVLAELRRLLARGGRVWLLVDLMEYTDVMHPHAFTENRLRDTLRVAGFEAEYERTDPDHKSHPEALGEYRAMLRRIGDDA